MRYCARCLYPGNAKPAIILDDEGVCSGCRYHESRNKIDWADREKKFKEFLELFKKKAREEGRPYDCIIPVSGGKDSHYQVHMVKFVYGLNPLLVTFNHSYNTALGVRNLNNLVSKTGCDLIRFTANPESARKISRYMLKKVGDLTWHYHAGIRTFPFQIAVRYKVPLIIWGEHGFAELTGMFTLDDMVEFTKWTRREHDMRGFEPDDLITPESGITKQDVVPYVYPTDEEIEGLGVRGIYMSNFVSWNAKEQAEIVIQKYDFGIFHEKRDRTFLLYGKTDDHANDVHDYLKYLKFGYGRATDDASMEIRHGRLSREEGVELVRQYDANRPRSLDGYLRFLRITEQEFLDWVEPMRDKSIWQKQGGRWVATDSVVDHAKDPGVARARVPLVPPQERTFSPRNRHLYYSAASEELWKSQGKASEVSRAEAHPEGGFIVL
jgi:N-acetyl sugar amidotransferase